MTNSIISFDVDGIGYSLYFGMVATEIISQKSIQAAEGGEINDIKAFAYIVYGGLCNHDDLHDRQRSSFQEAYIIAESIASDDKLTMKIYSVWSDSKPNKDLLERLNGTKKKVEVKRQLKKTGTK